MPSPTSIGRAAEQIATTHLEGLAYTILDRNWRNRWCELDIVARHGATIHFVEVKYRRNTAWGFAAEYISRDKSLRLRRAALAWVQAHRHSGPYQIDVVAVEGELTSPQVSYLPSAVE